MMSVRVPEGLAGAGGNRGEVFALQLSSKTDEVNVNVNGQASVMMKRLMSTRSNTRETGDKVSRRPSKRNTSEEQRGATRMVKRFASTTTAALY